MANISFVTPETATEEEITELVDEVFDYKSWSGQPAKIEASREVVDALKAATVAVIKHVPPSPDRTTAIRKLREARMDCNSAITHDGKF